MTLRAKFLLSLVLITGLITAAVLFVIRYRVEVRTREELARAVESSSVSGTKGDPVACSAAHPTSVSARTGFAGRIGPWR